ncbi:hypothetical protein ACFV1W_32330 [Kitasatospora sp. NPDC059648]|uniref:hypothetical protein n=1 Tax=Kitasatospora sp. NPDC059648 TaxID=3346894 RepID=UPI0036B65309
MAGVARVAVQEEIGRPVVGRRLQDSVTGTDRVARLKGPPGLAGDPVGGGQPLVVPAVVVALRDAQARRDDLAEVGSTIGDVAERAQGQN